MLQERQKGLLTLICDKVNSYGYRVGAHRNHNWHTQQYYELSEQMQGTLDRIGKVEYYRTFHIDETKPDPRPFHQFQRIGPDVYDHSLHFVWREPIGKGWLNPPKVMLEHTRDDGTIIPSSLTKDKAGNWHSPCDLAFNITLYHPNSQNGFECGEGQEAIGGCWLMKRPYPRWRPTYHYTNVEVIEALKIMCETFSWQFEEHDDSEYMILY